LAGKIFTSCRSSKEKMEAVASYFQQNYTYQLGIQIPQGQDPLMYFLLEKPPAHCEYFASGAALLLRIGGVPARYVTGFVAAEKNPYLGCWIARNKDAHAWVEAWDEQHGQWRLVEATAAGGVPTGRAAGKWDYWWDSVKYHLQSLRVAIYRDGLKGLGIWLGQMLLTWPVLVVMGVIFALLIVRRIRRRIRRRKKSRKLEPVVVELQRLLRQIDQRVGRQGFVRRPGETLHHFASYLEKQAQDDSVLLRAVDWYRRYADVRYCQGITIQDIQHLNRTAQI
jgi:protein-glutamine gamma-glutamyltransferase